MAMLENHPELSLSFLNEATQAWVEGEYNRKVHSETHQTPLERFLDDPAVARACPEPGTLDLAFLGEWVRTQRKRPTNHVLPSRRFLTEASRRGGEEWADARRSGERWRG